MVRRGYKAVSCVAWTILFMGLGETVTWGQGAPSVAQTVGVAALLNDEFGELLQGTAPSAHDYGLPVVEGDRQRGDETCQRSSSAPDSS